MVRFEVCAPTATFQWGPDFLLDACVVTLAMLTSFLQARRRSLAATVIQRAFRAWINRFTMDLTSTSTSNVPRLPRPMSCTVWRWPTHWLPSTSRLRWNDFDGFRTGHSSRLGKMARSRAGKRDYVVLDLTGLSSRFLLLRRPLARLTRVCSWVPGFSE